MVQGRDEGGHRLGPLHPGVDVDHFEAVAGRRDRSPEVCFRRAAETRHETHPERHQRQRERRVPLEEALGAEGS